MIDVKYLSTNEMFACIITNALPKTKFEHEKNLFLWCQILSQNGEMLENVLFCFMKFSPDEGIKP